MSTTRTSRTLFYQGDKLTTVAQAGRNQSILRHQNQPLAELHTEGEDKQLTRVMQTDAQGSVLRVNSSMGAESHCYTPYGHEPPPVSESALLGFNGQPKDPATATYLLGNGYRAYTPSTMRFNAPDSLSPFGDGGVNAYAYCTDDPVNHGDPSGHMRVYLRNGQMMQTSKNGAVAAGSWIKPALKDYSYRDSLISKKLQPPRTVAADNPVAEGRTHVRVAEVFRHPQSSLDIVHVPLMDMFEFQRNRAQMSVLAKLKQQPHAPSLDYAGRISELFDKNKELIARGERYWAKSNKVDPAVSRIRSTSPD